MTTSLRLVIAFSILAALCVAGCHSKEKETMGNFTEASASPRRSPTPVKSQVDVCSLLTSDDLKALQGEAYTKAERSDRLDGDFIIGQCYYALPTTVNSVVVSVTTAKDDTAGRTRTFWEQTFGKYEKEPEGKVEREPEKRKEREREQEKTQAPREREAGEEKEASPPERVPDLGDEAFWVGSPIGGALYMLKNDVLFRISVGGAGDQKAKLNKSKTLAQKILQRM